MPPDRIAQLAFPGRPRANWSSPSIRALKSPLGSLTQLVVFLDSNVVWAGAIDEAMVVRLPDMAPDARRALWARVLAGPRLWEVIRPAGLPVAGPRRRATAREDPRQSSVVASFGGS